MDKHKIQFILDNEMSDVWFRNWTVPDCQSLSFTTVECSYNISWVYIQIDR